MPRSVIEPAGHNPQDENPQAVIEAIRAFLAQEPPLRKSEREMLLEVSNR